MLGSIRLFGLAAFVVLGASPSHAQFQDDFESYANGSALDGQGGWAGWDGVNQNLTIVNQTQAFSGLQSISIVKDADTVQQFNYTSGQVTVSSQVYIPSGNGGSHWFILMDEYIVGGAKEWAGQVEFNNTTGNVECDCGAADAFTTPILYDQWAELRVEIDIDADFAEVYYDGVLLGSWVWSTGAFGTPNTPPVAFKAIDLYAQTGGPMKYTYFDDVKVDGSGGGNGTVYCDETQNPNNVADIAIDTIDSTASSINVTLTNGPANQFVYLLVGNGSNVVNNPPGTKGSLCVVGGNCLGRYDKDVAQIDAGGMYNIDLKNALSNPCQGGVNIVPGATWNFQFWHRQPMGVPSTFSAALAVTFN